VSTSVQPAPQSDVASGPEPQSEDVADKLTANLRRARAALGDEALAALERSLRDGADLPELALDDPLLALTVRLDREADQWRRLALEQQLHARRAGRFALAMMVVAAMLLVALVTTTLLSLLFSATDLGGRAWLVLSVSAAIVFVMLSGARVARLARGDHAKDSVRAERHARRIEDVLFRLGVWLALREADPESYAASLRREADAPLRPADD